MTIEVHWDDEDKTTIRYTIHEDWTWDEFYRALAQGQEMADEQTHPVHEIIDFTRVRQLHNGAATHPKKATRRPTRGLTVLVGAHALMLKLIIDALSEMFPGAARSIRYAESIEEARDLLRVDRPR